MTDIDKETTYFFKKTFQRAFDSIRLEYVLRVVKRKGVHNSVG